MENARVAELAHRTPAPFSGGAVSLAGKAGALGVGVFAVTIYALPQHLFPALESARVGVITAGLMCAGLAARWLLGGAAPTAGGYRVWGLVGFVAAALASPLWSLAPEASRIAGIEALKMAVVFLAAASLLSTPERVRKVAWAIALAGAVPAYYAVYNYLTDTNLLEGYRARWVGTFTDPNRLSMAVVTSLMLLLGLRAGMKNRLLRFLTLAIAALQIWAVVVTYSRGAALGLGVGLLAFLLVGSSGNRRVRSIAVVGSVALGLLFLAPERFWNRTETIASYDEDLSAMGRIYAWRTAGNILERRPMTGVGAAAFIPAWATYAPGDAGTEAYVAHNLFLEVAAELGIPALLAFLVLLGSCLWSAWAGTRSPSPVAEESRGLLAALLGYLVCQMFAGFMLSFFLFLLLGLATACERLVRARREAAVRPIQLRVLAANHEGT